LRLRLPTPLEVVHLVEARSIRTTAFILRRSVPDQTPVEPKWMQAYWRVESATRFLLNGENAEARVKEAVEEAANELSVRSVSTSCDLVVAARALLDERKLGISLYQLCSSGGCCGAGAAR
jgi:hypothetical protein